MRTLLLNSGIYPLRILYWLFALTAIIGVAVSVFSNDPEQGVWSGLFVSLLIYGIAHYLFLKPSRFLVDVRDGSESKHVNIPTTSYNDQRDNLFEFRISSNVETKTPNKSAGVWIGSEETIIVSGKTISKGLFYFGGQLKSLGGYGMEASLVDGMLPIEIKALNYADPSLGYWPTFNSLSPQARGAYISWLASERNDPDTPIGYVFIYFYGLERRILVDFKKGDVSDDEFLQIYDEVIRLRSIYSVNWSFKQYSARFVEYMCIISPDIINIRNEDIEGSVDSLLFKYRLANVIDSGEPLSAELAYAWIINHPDYQLRTPARRCKKEFKTLFLMYYSERFGTGLKIKPNKTRLKLVYRPASGSLRELSDESLDLPDPSVLTAPVKQLYSIAEECTEKLDSYSRYLGRKDNSRDDLAGILLLPDELIEKLNLPIFSKFKNWANESVKESFGLVSVKDFWMHTGLPLPEKINKREQEIITSLAEKSGFGIAPDHRFHHAKATVDENLVLFEGGHGDYFKPSKHFYDIGIKLRLGSMVASSDDINHASEIEFLQKLIDHSSGLSPLENKSLHAYLLWRLHSAPNMSGIKARLDKLSLQEKGVVSKILISVALADGKIAPQEVKELEKLYSALGLDKSLVTSDLHHRSSSKHTDIGAVAKTSHQTANTAAPQSNKVSFVLDDKVLAMHETETQDVQNMLGTIFKDDEFEPEETIFNHPEITDHLDDNLRALYEKIVQKDEWERYELQGICSSLGLMLDGAIEALNDWAFDQVDAPLIEDDESIIIDREIADELKEMEK